MVQFMILAVPTVGYFTWKYLIGEVDLYVMDLHVHAEVLYFLEQ